MNLIIVGAGKVGETLVESFIHENHDIVVLDVDAQRVNYLVNRYDVQGLVGSGVERSSLIDAGIEDADFLIACTSRDEVNILCSVLARKLGAKRTIARVRDPEYFKEMENMREDLGLDYFFNPELRAAVEIADILKFPSAKNVESFAGGRARMVELDISGENPVIGKTIAEISKEYGHKILFGMVSRGEEVIIPRGDFTLLSGDTVHIIGAETEIAKFSKKLKIYKPRAKSVFIIGGGKIAYYLAKELISLGVNVKIAEKDQERAAELSESLDKATVLVLDATEQETLDEENLKGADACVTLTGMDEENVIVSLYAKQRGVDKVITKVDRPSVQNMVKTLGLDTVISPRTAIANHIIRFVRANKAATESGINTLYKLHEKVEAVEFTVSNEFNRVGVPIKNLDIEKGVLIGGIVRGDEFILPSGDTVFLVGDRVIVVAAGKNIMALKEVVR